MKKRSILMLATVLIVCAEAFSQINNPVAKKEKLGQINFVSEITPKLWPTLWLPAKHRTALDHLSRMAYSESFIYAANYNTIIDYLFVEIVATCNGNTVVAQNYSDVLSTEQRKVLSAADVGSDLLIRIKFKFKDKSAGNENEIVEGQIKITVVPEVEAKFPGGFDHIAKYYKEVVTNKVTESNAARIIDRASVKFTVDEQGNITNAKIDRTTKNKKIDKLLLEATTNMPKWKPAKNSKGISVKQEFCILLGGGDGC